MRCKNTQTGQTCQRLKWPAGDSVSVIQSGGDQNLFNSGIVMVEDVHKAAAGLAFEEEPTVETQEVE